MRVVGMRGGDLPCLAAWTLVVYQPKIRDDTSINRSQLATSTHPLLVPLIGTDCLQTSLANLVSEKSWTNQSWSLFRWLLRDQFENRLLQAILQLNVVQVRIQIQ
jgi:hypothetical protein